MTFLHVSTQNLIHPAQCFVNSSVLDDDIAVMMPPPEIVRAMIEHAHAEFAYMKQV